ncbi:hypothetical protein IAQ61_010312 [Plenodomus lingam]|uniref:Similar to glutathione S-transferase n=1 Tax=Leptosphaeria maculans (strain JN3 / isolate v23.1.3 / race Av1-4-5-6-7-8) TaxID=985895 RepID=E5A3K3_LEPMJ|nr:similar to glutathione S-transferase [Plenodomus lingam JN3]KAH9862109.1 hypothetical protein IAQ61_010312 [Plenodomus lingam]CBX98216.1 similar to glutathione S-transferase [Plenodomus lingam JN3]
MVLTIHHLGLSQSERILLLLEEMAIPYTLTKHTRDPTMAPASLKQLPGNLTGQAPLMQDPDTGITLVESGAICDYILAKYKHEAKTKMSREYGEQGYADYVYFFHFANATLQPVMGQVMLLGLVKAPQDHVMVRYATNNMHQSLQILDDHLGHKKWLAGDDFTAADCMMIYSLTTKRYYGPLVSYAKYPNMVRYLKDVGERPAYKRAMEKGDPEMQVLLGAEPPEQSLVEVGGVTSDIWKKKT